MRQEAAEIYKRLTGSEPPLPWDERTDEDKELARQKFFAAVDNSSPEDEAAMDEYIAIIQRNLEESRSRVPQHENEDAA